MRPAAGGQTLESVDAAQRTWRLSSWANSWRSITSWTAASVRNARMTLSKKVRFTPQTFDRSLNIHPRHWSRSQLLLARRGSTFGTNRVSCFRRIRNARSMTKDGVDEHLQYLNGFKQTRSTMPAFRHACLSDSDGICRSWQRWEQRAFFRMGSNAPRSFKAIDAGHLQIHQYAVEGRPGCQRLSYACEAIYRNFDNCPACVPAIPRRNLLVRDRLSSTTSETKARLNLVGVFSRGLTGRVRYPCLSNAACRGSRLQHQKSMEAVTGLTKYAVKQVGL